MAVECCAEVSSLSTAPFFSSLVSVSLWVHSFLSSHHQHLRTTVTWIIVFNIISSEFTSDLLKCSQPQKNNSIVFVVALVGGWLINWRLAVHQAGNMNGQSIINRQVSLTCNPIRRMCFLGVVGRKTINLVTGLGAMTGVGDCNVVSHGHLIRMTDGHWWWTSIRLSRLHIKIGGMPSSLIFTCLQSQPPTMLSPRVSGC